MFVLNLFPFMSNFLSQLFELLKLLSGWYNWRVLFSEVTSEYLYFMSQSIDDMLQLVVLSNKSVFTDILDEHGWETIFRGEEGTAPDELNCLVCD